VFAVLVVGLGCEFLSASEIAEAIVPSGKRVEFIQIQSAGGTGKTVAQGRKIVSAMLAEAREMTRQHVPLSDLVLGTECGGSDYTSGLASNPALGKASDHLIADGGTVICLKPRSS
jgi:altronate dehydratase large subunit